MISGIRVYSLIDLALTYIGVTAPGESIDPAIGRMALLSLNNLRNAQADSYINQLPFDKRITIPTQSYHVSLGSYTPQDSSPVMNSKRIYVTIPKTLADGDVVNIEVNETDVGSITMSAIPGFSMQNKIVDAINAASLGVLAASISPFKILLTSNDDIGVFLSTSSPNRHADYKYTGDSSIRPSSITNISCEIGNIVYPMIIRSIMEYRKLSITTVSAIPQAAYIMDSFPIQNVYMYPGIGAGMALRLVGQSYPKEYERIDDAYIDPPNMFKPLAILLAADMAPSFGQTLAPDVLQNALSTIKTIKMHNMCVTTSLPRNDFTGGGTSGYSIWSGM